jgi:hypothetical protein
MLLTMPRSDGGIIGLYGSDGKPVVGYRVWIQQDSAPCGRISSLKFSAEGDVGAHVLATVGAAQPFFMTETGDSARLFSRPPSFIWTPEVMHSQGINDMWFSRQVVAADVSGVLWIGDIGTSTARRAADLQDAQPGAYQDAQVVGTDVFVSRWVDGRTEWLLARNGGLSKFLGGDSLDISTLVTDGRVIVWMEGRDPEPTGDSVRPLRFASYSLLSAAYTLEPSKLVPRVLVNSAPADLWYLTLANGYVAGIHLISPPDAPYRAGAIVADLDGGTARSADLPGGYSWGYEVYPAEDGLIGPITTGPMIHFETLARMPYGAMSKLE